MRYVGTRASETNPLRSIPLIRPVSAVFGHTDAFAVDWALQIARRDMAALEGGTAFRYAALGQANKVRGPMRRYWQAKAFRAINTHRAQLRAARRALVAAETAMLAFVPAVAA